jgi:hypothetical protein
MRLLTKEDIEKWPKSISFNHGEYDLNSMDAVTAFVENDAFISERKVLFEKTNKWINYVTGMQEHFNGVETILKREGETLTQEDFDTIYDMFS